VCTDVRDNLVINGQSQEEKNEYSNFLYIWNCFRSLLNILERAITTTRTTKTFRNRNATHGSHTPPAKSLRYSAQDSGA